MYVNIFLSLEEWGASLDDRSMLPKVCSGEETNERNDFVYSWRMYMWEGLEGGL